jgi:hypothetical protein
VVSLAKLRSDPEIPRNWHPPFPGLASDTAECIDGQVAHQLTGRSDHTLVAITFQPNGFGGLPSELWKLVDNFSRIMDAEHLGYGSNFRRRRMARPFYVILGQPAANGWHFHGLAGIPLAKLGDFMQLAPPVWKKLTCGGSMEILVDDLQPNAGWVSYIVRHLTNQQQTVDLHTIPHRTRTPKTIDLT